MSENRNEKRTGKPQSVLLKSLSYTTPEIQENTETNSKIRAFREVQIILKNSIRNKKSPNLKSKFVKIVCENKKILIEFR